MSSHFDTRKNLACCHASMNGNSGSLSVIIIHLLYEPSGTIDYERKVIKSSDKQTLIIWLDIPDVIRESDEYNTKIELFGENGINMTGKQKLVEFQIDNVTYGVDIDLVKEILMTWTIIPVSTFQKEISGVIFLRGDDVPIINIRHLFSIEKPATPQSGERIIIIGTLNAMWKSFGLLVDSVRNIIEILDQKPENMSSSDLPASHPYVKGYVTGRILVDGVCNVTRDEDIHPSVIWLNSDKLIDQTMERCIHLVPKIPYI